MQLTNDSTLVEIRDYVETIPEENIIIYNYQDREDLEKGCIIGQVNRVVKGNAGYSYDSKLEKKLRDASSSFLDSDINDIAEINNRKTGNYQQETPKARSLALINDMIKAGITL